MTHLVPMEREMRLPDLVDRAAMALTNARTSAEVLEARDLAGFAYDAAKRAARLSKAKRAHDDLIAAAHRTQANALEIEAAAKRRLADEYDAAQERGDVQKPGGDRMSNVPDGNNAPTVDEIGLTRKEIHDARLIRDAEQDDPGIVRRTLDGCLERGDEPTRAVLRRSVSDIRAAVRSAARDAALGGEKLPTPTQARELSRQAGGAGIVASDGKYHFHTTPEQDAARAHWHTLRYGILEDLETEATPEQAAAAVPPHMHDWVETRATERLSWLQAFLSIWRTLHDR